MPELVWITPKGGKAEHPALLLEESRGQIRVQWSSNKVEEWLLKEENDFVRDSDRCGRRGRRRAAPVPAKTKKAPTKKAAVPKKAAAKKEIPPKTATAKVTNKKQTTKSKQQTAKDAAKSNTKESSAQKRGRTPEDPPGTTSSKKRSKIADDVPTVATRKRPKIEDDTSEEESSVSSESSRDSESKQSATKKPTGKVTASAKKRSKIAGDTSEEESSADTESSSGDSSVVKQSTTKKLNGTNTVATSTKKLPKIAEDTSADESSEDSDSSGDSSEVKQSIGTAKQLAEKALKIAGKASEESSVDSASSVDASVVKQSTTKKLTRNVTTSAKNLSKIAEDTSGEESVSEDSSEAMYSTASKVPGGEKKDRNPIENKKESKITRTSSRRQTKNIAKKVDDTKSTEKEKMDVLKTTKRMSDSETAVKAAVISPHRGSKVMEEELIPESPVPPRQESAKKDRKVAPTADTAEKVATAPTQTKKMLATSGDRQQKTKHSEVAPAKQNQQSSTAAKKKDAKGGATKGKAARATLQKNDDQAEDSSLTTLETTVDSPKDETKRKPAAKAGKRGTLRDMDPVAKKSKKFAAAKIPARRRQGGDTAARQTHSGEGPTDNMEDASLLEKESKESMREEIVHASAAEGTGSEADRPGAAAATSCHSQLQASRDIADQRRRRCERRRSSQSGVEVIVRRDVGGVDGAVDEFDFHEDNSTTTASTTTSTTSMAAGRIPLSGSIDIGDAVEKKFRGYGWVQGEVLKIKKNRASGRHKFFVRFTMELDENQMRECYQVQESDSGISNSESSGKAS